MAGNKEDTRNEKNKNNLSLNATGGFFVWIQK